MLIQIIQLLFKFSNYSRNRDPRGDGSLGAQLPLRRGRRPADDRPRALRTAAPGEARAGRDQGVLERPRASFAAHTMY